MQHLDDGLLHALVDGEVPSRELGPIQAHLDQCAECRSRLEDARAVTTHSSELIELIEVPARATGRSNVAGHRARRWIRPVILAASLILAIGLGYAGGARWNPRSEDPTLAAMERTTVDTVFVPVERAIDRDQGAPSAPDSQPRQRSMAQALPRASRPSDTTTGPAERQTAGRAEKAAPAGREPDSTRPDRRLADMSFRLDEIVVTSANAGEKRSLSAKAGVARTDTSAMRRMAVTAAETPTPAAPAALQAQPPTSLVPEPITFIEAVARLGGQLRLIEGLVPSRLESIGRAVRVIYLLPEGELVLEQRRETDSITVALTAPWLSADSLGKLRARIR